MILQIRLKKEYNKPSTLNCIRENGSTTYSKIQLDFEIYDIAHYVVEKQLRLKNAFYGLLSQGYQINDFMLPNEKRPEALQPQNLRSEALATEHLVNLLTIYFMQTDSEMEIAKELNNILQEKNLSFPEKVSPEKIILIQKELANLMNRWHKLKSSETLEMIFES